MAIGPSGGMMKKLFDPANMKKKTKSALAFAKSGGPNIKKGSKFGGDEKPKGLKLMNSQGE